MEKTKKSPRVATDRQEGTTQEQLSIPNRAHNNSSIPIRSDTAAWWVERIKREKPEFYRSMAHKAIELSRSGIRLSIASLFEWARLELCATDNGVFKLNNNLRPAFARSLMRDFPELAGKFETRRSVSDGESSI